MEAKKNLIIENGNANAEPQRLQETVIERSVDFTVFSKGKVGHNKPLDKSRAAKMMGYVVYRRATLYDLSGDCPEEIEETHAMAQYVEPRGGFGADRPLSAWSDKLNPLLMFCRKVPVRVEAEPEVPSIRQVPGPKGPKAPDREFLFVVDYDKVAYWAERMLKVKCQVCNGTKRLAGSACEACMDTKGRSRGIVPLRTANTVAKLTYAAYLEEKARLERKREVEWHNIGTDAEGNAVLIATPKPRTIIEVGLTKDKDYCPRCMKVHETFFAEEVPEEKPSVADIEPAIREGDLIISDWETARLLIEQMRKVTVRAGKGKPKQRPFYGMDAVFERLYSDNEDTMQGVAMRGDPLGFAKRVYDKTSERSLRSQVETAMLNAWRKSLCATVETLDRLLTEAETIIAASESIVVEEMPTLPQEDRLPEAPAPQAAPILRVARKVL